MLIACNQHVISIHGLLAAEGHCVPDQDTFASAVVAVGLRSRSYNYDDDDDYYYYYFWPAGINPVGMKALEKEMKITNCNRLAGSE